MGAPRLFGCDSGHLLRGQWRQSQRERSANSLLSAPHASRKESALWPSGSNAGRRRQESVQCPLACHHVAVTTNKRTPRQECASQSVVLSHDQPSLARAPPRRRTGQTSRSEGFSLSNVNVITVLVRVHLRPPVLFAHTHTHTRSTSLPGRLFVCSFALCLSACLSHSPTET